MDIVAYPMEVALEGYSITLLAAAYAIPD